MQDYTIIQTGYVRELEEVVNRKLAEGYQLVGGISVDSFPNPNAPSQVVRLYVQAMVKP